jgi:hypothetical protein
MQAQAVEATRDEIRDLEQDQIEKPRCQRQIRIGMALRILSAENLR